MEKSDQNIEARNEEVGSATKALQIAVYPASAAAGLWMLDKEVHDSVYGNLKRYGAFKDVLEKGENGRPGLKVWNEKNVKDRILGDKPLEAYQAEAATTKALYSEKVAARMEHMGLGEGLQNLVHKWNSISRGGQRDAMVKAATAIGIVFAAGTVLADSKLVRGLLAKLDGSDKQR